MASDLLDRAEIGARIGFLAAEGTRQQQPEQAQVMQRGEQARRDALVALDRVAGGGDKRADGARTRQGI